MDVQIINSTLMNILFFAPSADEYIYIKPGGDMTSIPDDAEYINMLYDESLLCYNVYAYTMTQKSVYVDPCVIVQ